MTEASIFLAEEGVVMVDLTVNQVAEMIGVNRVTVTRWLKDDLEKRPKGERRFPNAYRPSGRYVKGSRWYIPEEDVLAHLKKIGKT